MREKCPNEYGKEQRAEVENERSEGAILNSSRRRQFAEVRPMVDIEADPQVRRK